MRIAYVDTETTGTGSHHVAWEVAVVVEEDWQVVHEDSWLVHTDVFDVDRAEPKALEVGGFAERYNDPSRMKYEGWVVANMLTDLTKGARLASCNVSFDTRYLSKLIATKGMRGMDPRPWHYSPVDVKSACYGRSPHLLGQKTSALMEAAGIFVDEGGIRHSALTDARIARRLFHWALAV